MRGRYVVTTVLCAAVVVVHAVRRALPLDDLDALVRMGSLLPMRVAEHGEYFRLVLPIFLHNDLLHLGLNLLALVQLGLLSEEFFGSRRTFVTFLTTGVAGTLCSALFTTVPYVTSVGASGAVLGLAGLLSGTMWFGAEPIRSELTAILGRRLTASVALTFAFGLGLWFVSDIVDNWAHAGGYFAGVCFAFVWSDTPAAVDDDEDDADDDEVVVETLGDPVENPVYRSAAAGLAWAVLVASIAWAALRGDDALATISLDAARTYAVRASLQPGAHQNARLLDEMLTRFDAAGAPDEGLETYTRLLGSFDASYSVAVLVTELDRASRGGADRDRALQLAAERFLVLSPGNPIALNAMAWYLVIPRDKGLRDPDRAEVLASRGLAVEPEEPFGWSCAASFVSDPRVTEAQLLDTRAEARFQLGRFEEALADQTRATDLAREAELDEIAQFESRLNKIERSARRK